VRKVINDILQRLPKKFQTLKEFENMAKKNDLVERSFFFAVLFESS